MKFAFAADGQKPLAGDGLIQVLGGLPHAAVDLAGLVRQKHCNIKVSACRVPQHRLGHHIRIIQLLPRLNIFNKQMRHFYPLFCNFL